MASQNSSCDTEVLIVGAGPTGLVLALWLARLGIQIRIIDKASEPGSTSRAMVLQGRTLEFYAQLGIADQIIAQGRGARAVNLWSNGHQRARIDFANIGAGISPYADPLIYPQDEHERFLINQLSSLGIAIERNAHLASFERAGDCIRAELIHADGRKESCTAAYLAGCDGAHSAVREGLGIGFPGGTYDHLFYVADVEAGGSILNNELNVTFEDDDFLVIFPLKDNRARFIGTVREDRNRTSELTWDDVSKRIIQNLRTSVTNVNWFSTYRVHHRVADQFRSGRAFLLGDAAHIHSPVGGQGMNTGIGDAVNLAWKLAAVLRGANPNLLDSYEPERIAFARRLVATTDRAFTQITGSGPIARFTRVDLAPFFAPLVFASATVRRLMFRTVSQVSITYRGSNLSRGIAGHIWGGDRLPWIANAGSDPGNFAPLRSLDWQVHVYGEAQPALHSVCNQRGLPLHVFEYTPATRGAGLRRNAAYLIRPDGYVALAEPSGDSTEIAAYLEARSITPFSSSQHLSS